MDGHVSASAVELPSAGRPPLRLRVMRRLIAALEWALRLLVLNRDLPAVRLGATDLSYGPHRKQSLDVLMPAAQQAGPVPLLVYIHGGAWVSGDKSNFAWVTRSLASSGLVVCSINYRWAPEAPLQEQLRDVARAVAWSRAHAAEHGADPDRVFLAGDSAGAHLACWHHVALHRPELLAAADLEPPLPAQALAGSLLLYGIYDLELAWSLDSAAIRLPVRSLLGAAPADVSPLATLASPLRHVTPAVAPMLVCAGERDALYGQAVRLVEVLQQNGVAHRALLLPRALFPDAGHSFINFGGRAASRLVLREARSFIQEQMRAQ